jgi:hypothetical protein
MVLEREILFMTKAAAVYLESLVKTYRNLILPAFRTFLQKGLGLALSRGLKPLLYGALWCCYQEMPFFFFSFEQK